MTLFISKVFDRNNILTAVLLSASLLFFCKTVSAQDTGSETNTVSPVTEQAVPADSANEAADETPKETISEAPTDASEEAPKESVSEAPKENFQDILNETPSSIIEVAQDVTPQSPVDAKTARRQAKIDEENARKQAKRDAVEAKKEAARQARQAILDAKAAKIAAVKKAKEDKKQADQEAREARMGSKSEKVQAVLKSKQEKRQAALDAKQAKIDAEKAKKQAKIDAIKEKRQVIIDDQNARKQAKIDAKNAKLQAKLDSKNETMSKAERKRQAKIDKMNEMKQVEEMKRQVRLDKKAEKLKAKHEARSLAAVAPSMSQDENVPCNALANRAKRESCLMNIVRRDAATADVCQQLKDIKSRYTGKCLTQLAVATKDDIYCRDIADAQERFACYHEEMFSSVKDMSVCESMRQAKSEDNVKGYIFGSCVSGVALSTENVEICDQISDDTFYANWFKCNVDVLKKTRNSRGCERISKRKKPFSARGDFSVKACRDQVEKVN